MIVCIVIFSIIWNIYRIKKWTFDYCCDSLSYVVVTGHRNFTTNDIIQNLIMQLGRLGAFVTQDVNLIQEKIEQLPWIRQVSVRKQWPDTLKIHLIEYVPIALWNDELLISTTGAIFQAPNFQEINKKYSNDTVWIPVLSGPEDKAQYILDNYLIFREILESNTLQIRSMKMDLACSLQLIVTGNIYLKLGRENCIERLCFFIKIYPDLLQKMQKKIKYIDYIDLRYRSGFAIKWN